MPPRMMWAALICLALSATVTAQQVEDFKSLEHGFSITYPKEMEITAYHGGAVNGLVSDSLVYLYVTGAMDVYVGASERYGLSLVEVAMRLQSDYEDVSLEDDPGYGYGTSPNETKKPGAFRVLNSTMAKVGGKEALIMEYLLPGENGDMRIKDVFVASDNMVYQMSFRAYDPNYKRLDQIYFMKMIDSFTIFPVNDTIEEGLPGFPKITSGSIWSSTALADVNGDKKLEIIFGTNDGNLNVLTPDGESINGFPVEVGDVIRSSPAVGDIDGNGVVDIVVGCDDGRLYAYDINGSILKGFPKEISGAISSSPALADLNGDGSLDIVVGSINRGIYAWQGDGSLICGYPVIAVGAVWSSPALYDLDGDGSLDSIVGSLSDCSSLYECMMQSMLGIDDGELYALDSKGRHLEGFSKYLEDPVGYSSPVIGDINRDGTMEIVVAGGKQIYVLSPDGEDLKGFPKKVEGNVQDSFISLGDIDRDGGLEIIAGSMDGRLYVWKGDGSYMDGFPIQTGGYVRHVTLGDINNDGLQEILGGSSDNRVHAWNINGTEVEGFPKVTLDDIETAPTLGDLNGDGTLDLIVGSNDGSLYAWKISDDYGDLDWPMMRANLRHTGVSLA